MGQTPFDSFHLELSESLLKGETSRKLVVLEAEILKKCDFHSITKNAITSFFQSDFHEIVFEAS